MVVKCDRAVPIHQSRGARATPLASCVCEARFGYRAACLALDLSTVATLANSSRVVCRSQLSRWVAATHSRPAPRPSVWTCYSLSSKRFRSSNTSSQQIKYTWIGRGLQLIFERMYLTDGLIIVVLYSNESWINIATWNTGLKIAAKLWQCRLADVQACYSSTVCPSVITIYHCITE